jgi:tetratricopeptide (TPR) repeat protein
MLKLKPVDKSCEIVIDFYKASGGSPLFAISILRLMLLGDSLKEAILNWKGADGERVREAAFGREIGRLKAPEAKVLLALMYMKRASAVELSAVSRLSRYDVQNCLATLQKFSMTKLDTSLPGGATFIVPNTFSTVKRLVEKRVDNWAEIKTDSEKYVDVAKNKTPYIADAVTRTMAKLKSGDSVGALEIAQAAVTSLPENPELLCLLGRVYSVRGDGRSEEAFSKAHALGFAKRALFDNWIQSRMDREDWDGVVQLALTAENAIKICHYRVLRNDAIQRKADGYMQAGIYARAEQNYEAAIRDVREGLPIYPYLADRARLWKLNQALVIRWLGAVQVQARNQRNGPRRQFGAFHKAIFAYKVGSEQLLQSALQSFNEWISKEKPPLSETAREQIEVGVRRLEQLRSWCDRSVSERAKDAINSELDSLKSRAQVLLH